MSRWDQQYEHLEIQRVALFECLVIKIIRYRKCWSQFICYNFINAEETSSKLWCGYGNAHAQCALRKMFLKQFQFIFKFNSVNKSAIIRTLDGIIKPCSSFRKATHSREQVAINLKWSTMNTMKSHEGTFYVTNSKQIFNFYESL